jgi:hypothetical protein
VPQIKSTVSPGGVYIGVGPEQNFTYIAAMRPSIAFIVDLRRDNLLLHLLYKAFFQAAPDRGAFVQLLFGRPPPGDWTTDSRAEALFDEATSIGVDPAAYERSRTMLRRVLVDELRFPLTDVDQAALDRMLRVFHENGPALTYATTTNGLTGETGAFASIVAQRDVRGTPLTFLGDEARYRIVRDLQRRNLVVPVVGNFAGPHALRAIGDYLRARGATVSVFYLSNVEEYLGPSRAAAAMRSEGEPLSLPPPNGRWLEFCRNVATMPLDASSRFLRPNGVAWFGPDGRFYLRRDIGMASTRRATAYDPGAAVTLMPPALSPIGPEVAECRS